ncbi:HAMP domain-containing sensor histidine kinase [Paenibacillus sp. P32E]|uniref:HAMP domain-containing sensor histidine kinase n=1 Tax=Paenibacillus sp. P32E TaxID=1349434 RepID=UPI00093F8158|nr:HAMP domain-containing sensor histidine kinase [Paenibacillus sp. P32E]OKP94182.1 vancomycin resistance histidine kinase VanS [Paenibacillus sp. P32E]
MARQQRSFRTSMLMLFGLSMLISGLFTYLVYKGLQMYYHKQVLAEDDIVRLRVFMNKVGDVNFFLILFVPLAIFFFFLLTKRYATYFDKISSGIHNLANGDFSARVDIASHDEFQVIADDINRASEQLQKAVARGDFAESSKDQLVLNLAHDIRTPLTSVLGYLDYILKSTDLSAEQARHYTLIAYTKSQRLEKLIEELFEITRMNYGMLTVEKKPIDLSELLFQLNEELYPLFEKNKLVSRLHITPQLMIPAEGELLARVFENLLTNAARYGRDGQYVDIHCRAEEGNAVVQVMNYGHFIPPEELPFLFDMFYTGDRARTSDKNSTGLGLFIAKNIVERHGGTITVESSITSTIFKVTLPLNA